MMVMNDLYCVIVLVVLVMIRASFGRFDTMAGETLASAIGFIPAIFYLNILKIVFGKVKCDVRYINPFLFY